METQPLKTFPFPMVDQALLNTHMQMSLGSISKSGGGGIEPRGLIEVYAYGGLVLN